MKCHLRRPSPALVVASLALVLSLGGTGYAALKLPRNSVGAAQIKANAVTSAKIKDGTLRMTDFKAADAPAGPQGIRGQEGPRGPAGPEGDAGPSGSSQGYAAKLAAGFVLSQYDKVVVSKDLPPGSYIVAASVNVRGAGSPGDYMGGISIADCEIGGYKTASVYLKANDTYVSEQKTLSLNSGVAHPGGPLALICSRTWNSVYIETAAMTAIKVDALG